MLEVKHLKRVYKVKNNEPVYALNDVSIKFQEKGLVFILGKSGSGKSTLLNVMGGLDKADEGEIIIEGKSSKEFSASEMDAYRNTYLGFIFQEYNILSDFTVKENIALALQLQHKKVTEKAINDILEQVDLSGYGKRKPNELSGGQKQRVAIARALVKEPKIIFGDEPTGALDSNTGKQVFETLKSLSKDKLVIIVSHDRDFAEHFGDRVIELRDGKVISDITKTSVVSEKKKEGISLLGENVIHIEKGHLLTAEDLPLLNKALEQSNEDMFISTDSHVNEAFCEAARIDKDGNREEFVDTDPSKLENGNETFAPIKSHFSLGHAFRMGARSLKVKPFRLVMTILLSTIAFSLFGSSAALSNFNKIDATISAAKNEKLSSFALSYTEKGSTSISSSRIEEIEKEGGAKLYAVSNVEGTLPVPSGESGDAFHLHRFSGAITCSDSLLEDFSYTIVSGSLPKAEDEIMISLYAYYSYADLGIGSSKASSDYVAPEEVSYEKVVGTSISLTTSNASGEYSMKTCKITGIFDSKLPEGFLSYRKKPAELTSKDENFTYYASLLQAQNCHNVVVLGRGDSGSSSPSGKASTNLLVAFGGDEAKLRSFLKYYFQKADETMYLDWESAEEGTYYLVINDAKIATVITTSTVLVVLTKVFLYVGIAMAVFSLLLFYNFISISINNKKREIGILRAVGAKKIDVFKVFYSEAFLIAMANFILSTALTAYITFSVNASFRSELSVPFGVMNMNFYTVLMLLAISLGASILSASLPVIRLANKKPIDAIHNK